MDAAVLLRVLPGDWRPQVVAPRMLEMDQEGRLALKVGHERADAEQVEDVEVVLDEEDVAAEIFVVGDSAVEDFPVEEIIVEDAAVDDAVVDDAVVEAAAVENAIVEDVAVDDAIVEDALEDAVEENATVDDTAAEDTTTEDDAGPADVTAEDAAEDDGFDEAEESGGLLYSRTSSVSTCANDDFFHCLSPDTTFDKTRASASQTEPEQSRYSNSRVPDKYCTKA